jgi:hypothetical protein
MILESTLRPLRRPCTAWPLQSETQNGDDGEWLCVFFTKRPSSRGHRRRQGEKGLRIMCGHLKVTPCSSLEVLDTNRVQPWDDPCWSCDILVLVYTAILVNKCQVITPWWWPLGHQEQSHPPSSCCFAQSEGRIVRGLRIGRLRIIN